MNKEIDKLSKMLFEGSTSAFNELKRLQMIIINIKITTTKMGDSEESRALSKTGDIIENALIKLEDSTKMVRDISKEIGKINREHNGDKEEK